MQMGKALFCLCFIACALTSVDLVMLGEFLNEPNSPQRKIETRQEMIVYVKREFDDLMLGKLMRRLMDMHLSKTRWR